MSSPNEEEIFESILVKRGLTDKKEREKFLNPDYNQLHDPFSLPDMSAAVKRLIKAKKNKETVCIYGDYDVDGLTATTLLIDAFEDFGINSQSYIPNRFTEGYGMSFEGVKAIAKTGAKLIVTVDCGSKSLDEIKLANKLGLDVVVTDHHTLGDELPDALAVVNPKRVDSKYPFSDLAGVGVAFKLVQALQTKLEGLEKGQEKWLLDLVAMGTTCDVVSLTDENRTIVHWGIEVAKKGRRPAFISLSKVSSSELGDIDTTTFGYRFGPRLNAAGRLETAQTGLDLLVSDDPQDADALAHELDIQNTERRAIQARIYHEAEAMAEKSDDKVLVLASKEWSHGVVGIVASKIVEEFKKPTFIIQILGDEAKGSARSIGEFNLAEALTATSAHTLKAGGHAMAAGVTLRAADVDKFRESINEHYSSLELKEQSDLNGVNEDVELSSLEGLNERLVKLLSQLEPYGAGNNKPVFKARLNVLDYRLVGGDKKHVKLTLGDDNGANVDAIGFNMAKGLPESSKVIDALFNIELNTFRNETKVQLNLLQASPVE